MDWKKLEVKWQGRWAEAGIFQADPDPDKPKYYLTVAYPYPNSPQHIGHGRTYTLTDVHARYRRMQGYNVLFPMAWHFTGTPVIAMVDRLKEKDPDLLDTFLNIYNIPEARLHELETAVGMATYFSQEIKSGMQRMGFSIDWRREFTTVDPIYSKFIEWQFAKLSQRGFIIQGSHPVGWCPKCGNPVGQHDTVGDKEPEIEEFTVLKFRMGDLIFPAATLRPETVFGVNSMWLNPDTLYVEVKVDDDETWVVSAEAANKLEFLGHNVEVVSEYLGNKLIGGTLTNPMTGTDMPILPASFVDPKNATGVVMSVPAHAPFDYVAQEQLKKQPKKYFEKYNLRPREIAKLKPISLIELPGWGESPAVDIVEKMGITDQEDPKLEKTTKEIYSQEFHNGRLRGNTGQYAGMTVERAKDAVKNDMVADGTATTMYELIEPVQCRCGSDVLVKIFENQWFIDYGDQSWKELAHENLDAAEIIPKELRQEYDNVIDWLNRKACARNVGMGTPLPWAPEWIIEALSDSTIYMAYYTVIKDINRLKPDPEKLTEQFWEYVFLGKGEVDEVAEETGIPVEELGKIKAQFDYFYPLDARHSGRDLIPNHLTFMIFNHDAIFPRENWPKGIVVNGSVLMEGQKMSKSLNNIIPLATAIHRFGTDPLRLALMITAEPLKDADFSPELAKSMADNLEKFSARAMEIISEPAEDGAELTEIDLWMLSRLQGYVREANEAMIEMKVRKTIHAALYNLNQDLDWYMKRVETQRERNGRRSAIQSVLRTVIETQIRLLTPFTPHLCEEIWEAMGNEGFIALSPWPEPDEGMVRKDAEELETVIRDSIDDVKKIIQVTGIVPGNVHFYTATGWKWKVYMKALELAEEGNLDIGNLIRKSFKDEELRTRQKEVPAFARIVVEDAKRTPGDTVRRKIEMGVVNETSLLEDAASFFEKEFGCNVTISNESDPWIEDPENRARRAKPYRPAIYVL
ncbi:MAG: leucine--tRNA ligase [Candidatus Bathyarchaeota archaeon]|nr:MAG: leucine--tRNA ligase [Candidatus Bathyarchaeota archaeon]